MTILNDIDLIKKEIDGLKVISNIFNIQRESNQLHRQKLESIKKKHLIFTQYQKLISDQLRKEEREFVTKTKFPQQTYPEIKPKIESERIKLPEPVEEKPPLIPPPGPITPFGGTSAGTLGKGSMVSGYVVTSPYLGRGGTHKGIDIGTPSGTFLSLSVPSKIIFAGLHGDYGNVIDAWASSLGIQFRLAHLRKLFVNTGDEVPAGSVMAETGGALSDYGAGRSTGPHLHFEADNKKGGTTYGGAGDPSPYARYLILNSQKPQINKASPVIVQQKKKAPPRRSQQNVGTRSKEDNLRSSSEVQKFIQFSSI